MRLLLIVLCIGLPALGYAQDPNYVLTLSGNGGNQITVNMDTSAGGDVQGWSWGVCNDPAVSPTDVIDGATTATANSGSAPDFDTINIFADGWTVGVVISFLGAAVLSPGSDYEMNIATYDTAGLAPGDGAAVTMCDQVLGTPPTANVVVVAGASFTPLGGLDATADVFGSADWAYDASEESDLGSGPSSSTVSFFVIDLSESNLENTQGFSMGWSNSSTNGTPVTVGVAQPAGDLTTLNAGAGPDFFGTSEFANGWTVGAVYAFLGGQFIQYPAGSPAVATVEYSYDITQDDVVDITVDNGLGTPPVSNVVVVMGSSFDASGESTPGSITITLQVATSFIRGDCNDDGIVNIADTVWLLNELFLSGPSSPCLTACDANGDTLVDATDGSYVLNYRFLDGPPPPAPFPDCGIDGGPACNASACP